MRPFLNAFIQFEDSKKEGFGILRGQKNSLDSNASKANAFNDGGDAHGDDDHDGHDDGDHGGHGDGDRDDHDDDDRGGHGGGDRDGHDDGGHDGRGVHDDDALTLLYLFHSSTGERQPKRQQIRLQ
ncbi:hypothetical protein TNCT_292761 [Trichonephila clavata]|uniref:Uncharacterized protein n=1 Tax=Trichonephila clavata TaxID=2740835 RepID=A0A8X6I384_TRICU|nr:hypothetical protein TNCT_292761 [Trichonephila clavata]